VGSNKRWAVRVAVVTVLGVLTASCTGQGAAKPGATASGASGTAPSAASSSIALAACSAPTSTATILIAGSPQSVPSCLATTTAIPAFATPRFSDVAFPDASHGFAVGRACAPGNLEACEGVVEATADGGKDWTQVYSGNYLPTMLDALSDAHAWALASASNCLDITPQAPCSTAVLTQGAPGQAWSVASILSDDVTGVSFASPLQGWASMGCPVAYAENTNFPTSCPGGVLATSDGGLHWRTVLTTSGPVVAIDANAGRVWAIEEAPGPDTTFSPAIRVLSTPGDVNAWAVTGQVAGVVGTSFDPQFTARLLFTSGTRGWLSLSEPSGCAMHGCSDEGVYETVDGGREWSMSTLPQPPPLGCTFGLFALAAGPSGALFAASPGGGSAACLPTDGAAYASGPSGAAWNVVHEFDLSGPGAMSWPTMDAGWAVIGGAVAATADGGKTWAQQLPALRPTAAVDFTDATHGWGVGLPSNPGAVLRTVDGGATWSPAGSVPGQATEINALDPTQSWVVDQVTEQNGDGVLWSIQTTTTGGGQWSDVYDLPGSPVYSGGRALVGLALFGQSALVGEPSGPSTGAQVLTSTDDGKTWGNAQSIPASSILQSLSFSDPSHGWALNYSGPASAPLVLEATANGGRSWTSLASLPSALAGQSGPGSIDLVTPTSGWIAVVDRLTATLTATAISMLHTTDSGHTWSRYVLPPAVAANTGEPVIFFLNDKLGWMLTASGLWTTDDGGATWSYPGA
jgi:photosystem II stability/assembly factor-like uncharacterized protein